MMKKYFLSIVCACISLLSFAQQSPAIANPLLLVPKPVSLAQPATRGSFVLPANPVIVAPANADLQRMAKQLAVRLQKGTGKTVQVKTGNQLLPNSILLALGTANKLPAQGYELTVNKTGISLRATDAAGIFYGIQTLWQLLPVEIESSGNAGSLTKWAVPFVTVSDYPRFGWRGLMLDVSRHFFTKEEVKHYIDDMVRYKFNLLHWHLTDDQGWRIEIKSLPKLTSVGAWRVDKVGRFGTFSTPAADEPRTYGGFYTQEDIKEVVQYAKERFVDILPEIDVPGHSLAAIASYPELSCTPGTYTVNSGEQFMIWPGGGKHFYGTLDNSLCPANEKVYEFMDKVFTEVAQLFPFEYIDMGGDETARNFWEKSDAIKTLMQKENLKSLDEVQSYFVHRMQKIIASKGKKMIGWDEILEGGDLPSGTAVMSWRGIKGGIQAAKAGHDVVMSPTDYAYIDFMQSDVVNEPPVHASLRLKKTYSFEPVPDGVDPSRIKGGQGNLWTEQIYNFRQAQYMTWPRGLALAEIFWSPRQTRNWDDFVLRVENQFRRFDLAKIKYGPGIYDPDVKVTRQDSSRIVVELIPEISGLSLHYSFDNSSPDEFYPAYEKPLLVPVDAMLLKVISYRNGKPIGRMMTLPVADLKKRAGIK